MMPVGCFFSQSGSELRLWCFRTGGGPLYRILPAIKSPATATGVFGAPAEVSDFGVCASRRAAAKPSPNRAASMFRFIVSIFQSAPSRFYSYSNLFRVLRNDPFRIRRAEVPTHLRRPRRISHSAGPQSFGTGWCAKCSSNPWSERPHGLKLLARDHFPCRLSKPQAIRRNSRKTLEGKTLKER